MHVFVHDDVCPYFESQSLASFVEGFQEGFFRTSCDQEWKPLIAGEREFMSVAGLVERLPSPSQLLGASVPPGVASPTNLGATDERCGISRQLQRVGRSSVPPEVAFADSPATGRGTRG